MAINIARRKFIAAIGGAVVAWPLVARAQPAGKLPTIGVLGSATPSTWIHYVAAHRRLHVVVDTALACTLEQGKGPMLAASGRSAV
jgi:hypothetical protein